MDPHLDTLHGPSPLQRKGTVSVPRDLLKTIGLDPSEGGHHVHWMLNPDMPGTLLLVPSTMVARAQPSIVEALRRHSS